MVALVAHDWLMLIPGKAAGRISPASSGIGLDSGRRVLHLESDAVASACLPDFCEPLPTQPSPEAARWYRLATRDQARRLQLIARKEGNRVRLYSRPSNDLTHRFPLIVETRVAEQPPNHTK
jgi:hypothetical protein